jgi:uracil phosphoribosyltransferase
LKTSSNSFTLLKNSKKSIMTTQTTQQLLDKYPQVTYTRHPLIADKLAQLRDINTKAKDFRKLVYDIGVLLTYEATREMKTATTRVTTPLCECDQERLAPRIALAPVLRAGLGMVEGFLAVLPDVQVVHVGLARNEETLEPVEYYNKLSQIQCDCDVALILDPMLASGGTAISSIQHLKKWGVAKVMLVCILASHVGIERILSEHSDVQIICAGIDAELNEKGYIVPGLGDAGDRQYNTIANHS